MVFGNGVKNLQAAAYNGACMVINKRIVWENEFIGVATLDLHNRNYFNLQLASLFLFYQSTLVFFSRARPFSIVSKKTNLGPALFVVLANNQGFMNLNQKKEITKTIILSDR